MTNHCEIVIFIQKVSAAQLKKIGKPVKVDEILINDVMNGYGYGYGFALRSMSRNPL